MIGTNKIRADEVAFKALAGRGKPLEEPFLEVRSEVLHTSTADSSAGFVIDGCVLRSLWLGGLGSVTGGVEVVEFLTVISTLPAKLLTVVGLFWNQVASFGFSFWA
jgi:hypothetical protein